MSTVEGFYVEMEDLLKEVFKACQQFREVRSSVKKWKDSREATIRLIEDLIPSARKSHQIEARVIVAACLGMAGFVGASVAGYPKVGLVLVAAGAIAGSYMAVPTLTAKVGWDYYFNKADVERAQRSLTQDRETTEQMNKLLSEFTLTESCERISQASSRYSREQAFTIVSVCCDCTREDELQDRLDAFQSPLESLIPSLSDYEVDTREVEVDLLQVVDSECAEAKLREIVDSLTSDVRTVQNLVAVLTNN